MPPFSVSGEGVVEVQATTGDNHLGGRDFDNFLMGSFVHEIKEKNPKDNYNGLGALNRVQAVFEQAKIALFSSDQTDIAAVSKIQKMVFDFFYGKESYNFLNVGEAVV
ncbi:70-kilodalton heat shock protein [Mortierella sp. GBA39]|nr:70-kilodalton heat shock protein [Mortierella sp. GBA39]